MPLIFPRIQAYYQKIGQICSKKEFLSQERGGVVGEKRTIRQKRLGCYFVYTHVAALDLLQVRIGSQTVIKKNCHQEKWTMRNKHSVLWFGNALIFKVISEVLQTLEWLQLVALFWSSIWIWKTHGNFDKISCVAKCTVPVETTTGASSILISFKHSPVLERTWPREQRTKSTTINYMNFP